MFTDFFLTIATSALRSYIHTWHATRGQCGVCECSQVKICEALWTLRKFSLASAEVASGRKSMFKKLAPGRATKTDRHSLRLRICSGVGALHTRCFSRVLFLRGSRKGNEPVSSFGRARIVHKLSDRAISHLYTTQRIVFQETLHGGNQSKII